LLSKHDKSCNIIVECISRHAAPSASGTKSKCQQNTKRIWPYSSSRSSTLVSMERLHISH